ncbi:MAG: PAS domain-containing sensor histidine kinase [Sulfuricurvum sp.]|nr:PAS domain-containing sensor histidine kinase [Sulfuricurvum sp.]
MIPHTLNEQLFEVGEIIDHSMNEIYTFDPESLHFTYGNRSAIDNLGYSFDELTQMTLLDINAEYSYRRFLKRIQPLKEERTQQLVFEALHRHKSGKTYNVEVHMQLITLHGKKSILAIALDTSDRKKLQEQLEQKNELYKKIVSELAEQANILVRYKDKIDKNIIVSMTDKNGFITHISEEFEKATGYTKQEVIGNTHALFRHPDMSKIFYREMWNILLKDKEWKGEIKNRHKNGSEYWLFSHIVSDHDTEGNLIGYSAIAHDITNKKKLESLSNELEERIKNEVEKNRVQTAQMVEQSRLAQMGEMISMIAHQWRQPLASISAISSTLSIDVMMDDYKKDFFEERLESIAEIAQHLSSTIDDFRGFFKKEKKKESIYPREIIQGCLNIIGPTLENTGIKVTTIFEETTPLYSYTNELKQVILNILKNAEDALLDSNSLEKKIEIHCYEKDSYSYISIEDNAGGVPNNIINKIFDPYFSTKKQKDGTGLGLYMSKTIIEEHCRGNLSSQNTKDGACFLLRFNLNNKEKNL